MVTPAGVGFPMRVTDNWLLVPFVDFGVGWLSYDENFTVGGVGAKSRAVFATKPVDYVLVNRLVYARASSSEFFEAETFTQLKTELDVRRLITHRIKQRSFDFALYARNDFYPGGLEILGETLSLLEVDLRWQIGFTWGSEDTWKPLWKVRAPRIGLAYVFGDGADGYRFIIRFRS